MNTPIDRLARLKFDICAQRAKLRGLLKWFAARKGHAFNARAGKNPVSDFIHRLVTMLIEWVGGSVETAGAAQAGSAGASRCAIAGAREHRTAEQQGELAVIRARDAILRARTLLINTARDIAKGFGLRLPKSITRTFGKRALVDLPAMLQTALGGLLEQIHALSQRIANYDQQIGELAERHSELERLASIPGVGKLTALTFVLTLGRPERFAHSRDVAGFLGLRPKQRQSGGRDPQLGISKSGDPYLRKLLVQCSHYILGHWGKDSALRRWGLAKSEGGHKASMRAIVAVARKLSVLLHRLWVSGEFYMAFPQMA